MHGARRTGKIINLINLREVRRTQSGDVALQEFDALRDIGFSTGIKIIDDYDMIIIF